MTAQGSFARSNAHLGPSPVCLQGTILAYRLPEANEELEYDHTLCPLLLVAEQVLLSAVLPGLVHRGGTGTSTKYARFPASRNGPSSSAGVRKTPGLRISSQAYPGPMPSRPVLRVIPRIAAFAAAMQDR